MHHHVGAQFQRTLQQRRGPRVVASHQRAGLFCDGDHCAQVCDVEQRVGRRFRPDKFGRRSHGAFHRIQVLHVNEGILQSPAVHHGFEQRGRTVIRIFGGDHVVADRQRLQYGHGSGAAGRERQRCGTFFQSTLF